MTNQWFQHQQPHGHGHNPNRIITITEAMGIALSQVPGQVVKIELEHERGRQMWEVDIRAHNGVKYTVEIDAHSGQVSRVKVD